MFMIIGPYTSLPPSPPPHKDDRLSTRRVFLLSRPRHPLPFPCFLILLITHPLPGTGRGASIRGMASPPGRTRLVGGYDEDDGAGSKVRVSRIMKVRSCRGYYRRGVEILGGGGVMPWMLYVFVIA